MFLTRPLGDIIELIQNGTTANQNKEGLGLKGNKKTLHSLRHSFITYLTAAGAEGAIIKSLAGHEPNTVTSGIYTHFGIDHLPVFKQAIEKLPY